jgi:hypothetical protein
MKRCFIGAITSLICLAEAGVSRADDLNGNISIFVTGGGNVVVTSGNHRRVVIQGDGNVVVRYRNRNFRRNIAPNVSWQQPEVTTVQPETQVLSTPQAWGPNTEPEPPPEGSSAARPVSRAGRVANRKLTEAGGRPWGPAM